MGRLPRMEWYNINFAQNHVGGVKQLLPTVHGFDAFLGSLGIVSIDQGGSMDRGWAQVWRQAW
jgi:hypothetical protein